MSARIDPDSPFPMPMSYRQIGRVLGISWQAVQQQEAAALRKVRRRLLERLRIECGAGDDHPEIQQLRRVLRLVK